MLSMPPDADPAAFILSGGKVTSRPQADSDPFQASPPPNLKQVFDTYMHGDTDAGLAGRHQHRRVRGLRGGVLAPELKRGDVVIWDDLKPHQSENAVEAVEADGARVVPLPPRSPDLTPSEEMISKINGAMRAAARTTEAVSAAFGSALHEMSLKDIAGWFQDRAVYVMQPLSRYRKENRQAGVLLRRLPWTCDAFARSDADNASHRLGHGARPSDFLQNSTRLPKPILA